MELGPGALMAKFDIECAYRNIPIRPDERYLFGMCWRDQFFVDMTLPFGLRSAPFIFNSVADMVEWILKSNYHFRFLLHYLDDFLTLAPARSSECAINVDTARSVFARLGLPLHPTKCEGPVPSLVFLGIELDSLAQMARLPSAKLALTLKLLHRWAAKRWCSRKELLSLIGSLQHVCKVVPPGRSFVRRMIDLLCVFRSPSHPIRLHLEFRRDLAWWLEFLRSWNGVSFFRSPSIRSLTDFFVASDASGAIGFGAVWRNEWFAGFASVPSTNTTVLELFPIVVAAHVWGHRWQRLQVEFLCDDNAVVAHSRSQTLRGPPPGSSRDKLSMHLVRRIRSRHLSPSDVNFLPGHPGPGLRLRIEVSKTNPFGAVHCTLVVELVVPRTISVLSKHFNCTLLVVGPHRVNWLFCPPESSHSRPRQLARAGWLFRDFSSHSFRIGAATRTAAAGIPDHLIHSLDHPRLSSLRSHGTGYFFFALPAAVRVGDIVEEVNGNLSPTPSVRGWS